MPAITKNLISISKFAKDNAVFFEFHPDFCHVKSQATKEVLLQGTVRDDGLYCFTNMHPQKSTVFFNSSCNTHTVAPSSVSSQQNVCNSPYMIWHQRFGHPHAIVVQSVLKNCNIHCENKSEFCTASSIAKAHKLPSSPSQHKYTSPLELLFMDVWGPSPGKSKYGSSYYLSVVDAHSRYTWMFPLQEKSDVADTFKLFQNMVELQLGCKIKQVQSDWGGEFRPLAQHFNSSGIIHRASCPHTHHQNGVVEHKHRHITETSLAHLANAQYLLSFGKMLSPLLIPHK